MADVIVSMGYRREAFQSEAIDGHKVVKDKYLITVFIIELNVYCVYGILF